MTKQNRLVDLINKLYDENINVTFIGGSNTLEVESDKTSISIEVYSLNNIDLVAMELEDNDLSELDIQTYNYSIASPTLKNAYEMIVNEINYNELNGIECI